MAHTDDRRARFEALFDAYARPVRAYVTRRAPAAAVDDVIAETFIVAWRRLDEIGEDPLPWLFGVARRVLANELRSDRRRAALRDRLAGDRATADRATTDSATADRPSRRRSPTPPAWAPPPSLPDGLAAAIVALGPREREALLLTAWEGLDPTRGARAAGCTPAAFRVRLHRARRRVAQRLTGADAPTTPLAEEPR